MTRGATCVLFPVQEDEGGGANQPVALASAQPTHKIAQHLLVRRSQVQRIMAQRGGAQHSNAMHHRPGGVSHLIRAKTGTHRKDARVDAASDRLHQQAIGRTFAMQLRHHRFSRRFCMFGAGDVVNINRK